jgi:hypothetical protein
LVQAHASLEFDRTASRWTESLRSKSGETIGFQARSLLMIVLLSVVRLDRAVQSAILFGNAGVQLGVGDMTKVFNWVSNITSVGTTTLKDLWQMTVQDVDTGIMNIGTVYARRQRQRANGRGAHEI